MSLAETACSIVNIPMNSIIQIGAGNLPTNESSMPPLLGGVVTTSFISGLQKEGAPSLCPFRNITKRERTDRATCVIMARSRARKNAAEIPIAVERQAQHISQ